MTPLHLQLKSRIAEVESRIEDVKRFKRYAKIIFKKDWQGYVREKAELDRMHEELKKELAGLKSNLSSS